MSVRKVIQLTSLYYWLKSIYVRTYICPIFRTRGQNSREVRTLKVVLGDQNPPRWTRDAACSESQRGGNSARAMAGELFASATNIFGHINDRSGGIPTDIDFGFPGK
jgi:hypothetical protein